MKLKFFIMSLFFIVLFLSCQNSLEESDYELKTTTANLNIYAIQLHLTDFPNKVSKNIDLYPMSDNETIFSNAISLSNSTQYTAHFSFNNDHNNQLVWAMYDNYLDFYNPLSELQSIQKLRKMPVAFKTTISGEYSFIIDTSKLSLKISPEANVTNLYDFDSLHFVSSLDNWEILTNNNMYPLSDDDFYIIVTNLSPGQYFDFKFVLGDEGLIYYSKDSNNPLSQNNKLLDAEVTTGSPFAPLTKFITAENCIIQFNILAQSYSIIMNEQPVIGDGFYESDFYGAAVLTNTNSNAPIRNLYFRQTPNGFYFGIDGNFIVGAGLAEATGLQLVLLLDETTVNDGFKGSFSLYSLPPIEIHVSSSVENMLILEASNPKLVLDGTDAIKDGVKLYSKLTNGMDANMIENRKTVLTYDLHESGYFRHGDIYEIFIPRMIGSQTNWNPGSLRIIGFSWNADTNWGVISNSNTLPINQALPNMADTNKLPFASNWTDIN